MSSPTPGAVRVLPLAFLFLLLPAGTAVRAAAVERTVLDEIGRHATEHQLTIGFAAVHLESGRQISLNGNTPFPLASTYKVPMAAYALHLVEAGQLALDQMIEVEQRDLVISSPITRLFPHPGIQLSLLNLLEATLIQSDNTATDVLLKTVGGGQAVTRWLADQGITDMRVDRSTASLIMEYMGMPESNDESSMAVQYAATNFDHLTDADWRELYQRLLADPRDQGTPRAMLQLLTGLWRDAYLNAAHGAQLRAIMGRCLTGGARLAAGLPAQQLPLAHKTGTIGGSVNDVGVLELPDGRGTVAIVVFTRGESTLDTRAGEQAIAEVGRTVYDYFLFSEPTREEPSAR